MNNLNPNSTHYYNYTNSSIILREGGNEKPRPTLIRRISQLTLSDERWCPSTKFSRGRRKIPPGTGWVSEKGKMRSRETHWYVESHNWNLAMNVDIPPTDHDSQNRRCFLCNRIISLSRPQHGGSIIRILDGNVTFDVNGVMEWEPYRRGVRS